MLWGHHTAAGLEMPRLLWNPLDEQMGLGQGHQLQSQIIYGDRDTKTRFHKTGWAKSILKWAVRKKNGQFLCLFLPTIISSSNTALTSVLQQSGIHPSPWWACSAQQPNKKLIQQKSGFHQFSTQSWFTNQTSTEPAREKLQQHAASSGTAFFSSKELAKPIVQNLMYKAPKQRTNSGVVVTIACAFPS